MSKPIAVVYWMEEGKEQSKAIYTQEVLDATLYGYRKRNVFHWTCLVDGHAYVPRRTA